jgi:hypothetical protein
VAAVRASSGALGAFGRASSLCGAIAFAASSAATGAWADERVVAPSTSTSTSTSTSAGVVSSATPGALSPLPPITDAAILGGPEPFRLESLMARYTMYAQDGHGWQSRQSTPSAPGSEWLRVYEPQLELVFRQGDRWRHRAFIPVDFVASASPVVPGPDAISAASKENQGGSLDWTSSYRADAQETWDFRAGIHIERMYRSWVVGGGYRRSFLDDDATIAANVNQVNDWFDTYDVTGARHGHGNRSTTNANVGFTRVLSPEAIAEVNYGLTVQSGELGNTWGSVPLSNGWQGTESYPHTRIRHALVGRIAQWLPWNGAVRLFARGYADDWGIAAGTFELELLQRFSRMFYVRASYRVHRQTGASFFTTLADPAQTPATADSDLQELTAQSLGLKLAFDVPVSPRLFGARTTHFDVGLTRYFRDNDLAVWVLSCGFGLRF